MLRVAAIASGIALRAFPFPQSLREFIGCHDKVLVVEQNRDGQMHPKLVNERDVDPARLARVLHFYDTPIDARFNRGGDPPVLLAAEGGRMPPVAKPPLQG